MKKNNRLLAVLSADHSLGVFVAIEKTDSPEKIMVKAHTCPKCETTATLNNMDSPACPVCATDMIPVPNSDTLEIDPKKDLKDYPVIACCDSCSAEIHGDKKLMTKAANAGINCYVCSNPMVIIAADDEDTGEDDENLDDVEAPGGEDDANVVEDESEDETDDETDDDSEHETETMAGDDEDSDSDEADFSDVDTDEDMSEDDNEPVSDEDDVSNESESDEDESDNEDSEETASEKVDETEGKKPEVKVDGKIKAEEKPALTIAASAINQAIRVGAEIELLASTLEDNGIRYHLFGNGNHLAAADKARASKSVAEIFNDQKVFRESFMASIAAENADIDATLNNFGFEKTNIDIPVDIATKEHIDNEVAKKTVAFNVSKEEIKNRFSRALSTAALGIRKGMFGVESPLRTKLVKVLSENGIRGADRIADELIKETTADELKLQLSKADELVNKSDDALGEIASVAETAAFMSTASAIEESKPTTPRLFVPRETTAASMKSPELPTASRAARTLLHRNRNRG